VYVKKKYKRKKELLKNGALVVVVVALFLFVMEVRLRLTSNPDFQAQDAKEYFEYNELLGWRNKPHSKGYLATTEFNVSIKHNSIGLRDKEYSVEKPPGSRRILVFGDSFTWGSGVEQNDIFVEKLENMLPDNYEVLNFGVAGYGTDQEYLVYNSFARNFSPDIVILALYVNDFETNIVDVAYGHYKPVFVSNPDKSMSLMNVPVPPDTETKKTSKTQYKGSYLIRYVKNTYACRWIYYNVQNLLGITETEDFIGYEFEMLRKNYIRPLIEYSVSLTTSLISGFDAEVKQNNSDFVLVYIPTKIQVSEKDWRRGVLVNHLNEEDFDLDNINRKLVDFTAFSNIHYIDLTPAMRDVKGAYYDIDPHWTEKGHEIAAKQIYDWITVQGYLE